MFETPDNTHPRPVLQAVRFGSLRSYFLYPQSAKSVHETVSPALSSVSSRNSQQCGGLPSSISHYISAMLHQIIYDTLS